MCGVIGVVLEKEVSVEKKKKFEEQLKMLYLASEIRGQDGTGMAYQSFEPHGVTLEWAKKLMTDTPEVCLDVENLTENFASYHTDKKVSEWFSSIHKLGGSGGLFHEPGAISVGQTRLAIFGLDKSNNQPLISEKYAVVHNGNLFDFEKVFVEEGLERRLKVDTELILRILERDGRPDRCFDLKGNFACVVLDRTNHQLFAFRRDKPLYMRAIPGVGVVFFSTERIGRKVFGPDAVIKELEENKVFTFKPA